MEMQNSKLSERNMELLLTLTLRPSRRKSLLTLPSITSRFTKLWESSTLTGKPGSTTKLDTPLLLSDIKFWEVHSKPPIPLTKRFFNKVLMDFLRKTSSLIPPPSSHVSMMLQLIKLLSSSDKSLRRPPRVPSQILFLLRI